MVKLNKFLILFVLCSFSLISTLKIKTKKYEYFLAPVYPTRYVPNDAFDPEPYAIKLRDAVKGAGTDEDKIIEVIKETNWFERQEIRQFYDGAYGRKLYNDLYNDLRGDFRHLVVSMFKYPGEYCGDDLYDSMKRWGTDEEGLNDILITRTGEEIKLTRQYFDYYYSWPLDSWITDETSGFYRKILRALLEGNRKINTTPNAEKCKKDAETLKEKKGKGWGKEEELFTLIFTTRSFEEIKVIAEEYEQIAGQSLEKAIKKEFSGDTKNCLLDILQFSLDPALYYAKRIRKAVKGWGTNERKIDRSIIFALESGILKQVIEAYKQEYDRDMIKDIKSDTSGDYQDLLMTILEQAKA